MKIDQLLQAYNGVVWDGNLISKQDRDQLITDGYLTRKYGYNIITPKAVAVLVKLGFIDCGVQKVRADQLQLDTTKSIQATCYEEDRHAEYARRGFTSCPRCSSSLP